MADKQRLDLWLWHARFFKTRSLATRQVKDGQVRVNSTRAGKPAHPIGPQDVLTFAQGRAIRVIEVVALATRRGPAPEAQALYNDLSPLPASEPLACTDTPRFDGKGRPTKKDRRAHDLSKRGHLD